VILPDYAAPGLHSVDVAQRHVLESIAAAIRAVGAPVTLMGLGDLVIGDRKCGGSAQRRLKHWFMVHCSILYDFPIARIERYLSVPSRQPAYRAGRTHSEFLSNLGMARKILVEEIASNHPRGRGISTAPEPPQTLLDQLLSEKFSNPAWIERF
jgi:lipoate-protein ligase A